MFLCAPIIARVLSMPHVLQRMPQLFWDVFSDCVSVTTWLAFLGTGHVCRLEDRRRMMQTVHGMRQRMKDMLLAFQREGLLLPMFNDIVHPACVLDTDLRGPTFWHASFWLVDTTHTERWQDYEDDTETTDLALCLRSNAGRTADLDVALATLRTCEFEMQWYPNADPAHLSPDQLRKFPMLPGQSEWMANGTYVLLYIRCATLGASMCLWETVSFPTTSPTTSDSDSL